MTKHLGKRPPANDIGATSAKFVPCVSMELAEHFRQSLIEAADESESLVRDCGSCQLLRLDKKATHCSYCAGCLLPLAKKLRISAGEKL